MDQICRENSKYSLNKNCYGHFWPRLADLFGNKGSVRLNGFGYKRILGNSTQISKTSPFLQDIRILCQNSRKASSDNLDVVNGYGDSQAQGLPCNLIWWQLPLLSHHSKCAATKYTIISLVSVCHKFVNIVFPSLPLHWPCRPPIACQRPIQTWITPC